MSVATAIVKAAPAGHASPLLAILVPEGSLPPSLAALDAQTGGALGRLYTAKDFQGKKDETALLHPTGPAARLLLVGLGKGDGELRSAVRRGAAVAAKRGRVIGVESMALALAEEVALSGAGDAARLMAEGAAQGAWFYDALKKPAEETRPKLGRVDLLFAKDAAEAEKGRAIGDAIGAGHSFTRDLQVLPGNLCTPAHLGEAAITLAGRHGHKVTVLDKAALEAEGMHALMAVGQGSAQAPRFIVLEYEGDKGAPVVLVGKGVTFDSGGISIKPASGMWRMKGDMSGAAAVTGAVLALARSRAPVHVIAVAALAENMPDGNAQRPGDVVRTMSGRTIEIINTDAEGRLVLADALEYVASRRNPAAIVDIATLTGAASAALGEDYAALFARDEGLAAGLEAAGKATGELVWRMPLHPRYADTIRSDVADVTNSVEGASPGAGLGAAFVGHFVDPAMPWAHIDMAGTMASSGKPLAPKGMSGYGVRLLEAFARDWRPAARN